MIKFSVFFLLAFSSFILFSKPYYSEYVEKHFFKEYIVIFHGNIKEEDEAKVRVLEQKYLEHRNMRGGLKNKLNSLGISIEEIQNIDRRRAKKIPHPPEFHHMP